MIEKISNKLEHINAKKMFKFLGIMLIFYITFKVYEQSVSANILDALGQPDNFNGLAGDGKYLGHPYKNNYYLDVKKLGLTDVFDKSTNFLANFFWSAVVILTYVLLIVFNLAFSMDIANMFDGILNAILTSLRTTIFDEYFLLAASIGLIYVAISFFRNNTGQMLSRFSYIVFAVFLMTVTTMYASNIVSIVTTMSKGIGASSIVAISSNETTEGTIGQVSGELWGNLVHRPWLELEFDGKHGDVEDLSTVVESILSLDPDSDERQDVIDKLNKGNSELFKESEGAGRIIPAILIFIVNGLKMGVMLAIAFIQIIFQLMTILFVLTLPVMILLSISPSFGGSQVLVGVGKQILGAQVGIVLTSFLLGLMIKLDSLVATYLGGMGTYGWLAITIVQTGIYIGVVMQRKQIFLALMSIQRRLSVASAGVWRGAMKASDKAVDKTKEGVRSAGEATGNGVRSARDAGAEAKDRVVNSFENMATRAGDGIRSMHSKSSDFAGSVADRLRNAQENRANAARDNANENTAATPQEQSTEKPRPNINIAAAGARNLNNGENNINENPNNKQEKPIKPIREPNNKVSDRDNLEIDTAGNEPKVLRDPNELKNNNNNGETVDAEKPKINGNNNNKSSNDKTNEKDKVNPSSETETTKPSPKVVRDNNEANNNTIKMTDELRNKPSNNTENNNIKKANKVRNIENTEPKNNPKDIKETRGNKKNNNSEINNKGSSNIEVKKDYTIKNNGRSKENKPITNNDRAKMFKKNIR